MAQWQEKQANFSLMGDQLKNTRIGLKILTGLHNDMQFSHQIIKEHQLPKPLSRDYEGKTFRSEP